MLSARRFASDHARCVGEGLRFESAFVTIQIFRLLANGITHAVSETVDCESAMPLQSIEDSFAVDSSGFSTSTYVRWFDVKYGNNEDWHDWVKMHLMCGVKTHIVTSVEMSRATANDSPFLNRCSSKPQRPDST